MIINYFHRVSIIGIVIILGGVRWFVFDSGARFRKSRYECCILLLITSRKMCTSERISAIISAIATEVYRHMLH